MCDFHINCLFQQKCPLRMRCLFRTSCVIHIGANFSQTRLKPSNLLLEHMVLRTPPHILLNIWNGPCNLGKGEGNIHQCVGRIRVGSYTSVRRGKQSSVQGAHLGWDHVICTGYTFGEDQLYTSECILERDQLHASSNISEGTIDVSPWAHLREGGHLPGSGKRTEIPII